MKNALDSNIELPSPKKMNIPLLSGIGFTALIAAAGTILSYLPVFNKIGPLAAAILLAVLYRHLYGYPETLRTGISFTGKRILRFAIILYGLKLNIFLVLNEGLGMLAQGALTIVFAIGLMILLGKWLKADPHVILLLGIGTGICGAAAIAAAAPILQTKEEDTAMSVGMIAFFGTIAAILYTLLFPLTGMSPETYGIWSGITLHEIAHVALAGAAAGEDALTIALLAKLGRVLLLLPVCFLLVYWMRKKSPESDIASTAPFPWFLIGFLAASVLATYGTANGWLTASEISHVSTGGTFLLTMAMTGLGLNVDLRQLKQKAVKPLIALTITSVCLSAMWALLFT
ncbi:putative integral membrane protein (TIGR00698 family) [Bacillus ectoiniformans]|uniref:YeiH family protein n=1 Tax=Bacillus ectoiniformans TaxID=1494429 RepID=UPI0019591E23|nr:putative sulfate exporter family transporter [Bacillus ectoiniformans]MBM7649532.1 putative integral membrane protein (TIGR00698 family) [Bacillus ectoiniformans]